MTNHYPPQSVGPTDVGPYRLVRMIGEGGMGAVYYALRRSDNLAVALKILPRSLAMDSDQLARFRREAAVAMGLDHPNVVGCIDVDQADGYNFMVMEFVGGGDAEELLRRSGGRISERRAMSVALDITKALHHASSFGLVHRDIKPENLLFTESGLAKMTDFGLVKRTAENLRITERGKAMGTPHFMAPEQARGKRDLDVRSDIYSLGATIYYLLAGRTPYNGNSAFEIVSQLASEPPPPLASHRADLSQSCLFIIECMMSRELEDRPQSAKDLLVMIEAYFNGRPIPHPRDLTKQEKPQTEVLTGDARKTTDANPLKKLKAAEFQGTPREAKRPDPAHEPPANALTRHFLGTPTRIIAKGAAAPPPPPAPETVSMPSMGTTVPLIKQNADSRRPAMAGSSPTPSGVPSTAVRSGPGTAAFARSGQSDLKAPPQEIPSPVQPPQAYPPQLSYPEANESGEQIAADLDMPLPAVKFPPTPPAGVLGIVNTAGGLPPIPSPPPLRTARPETSFYRRDGSPAASPPPPGVPGESRNATLFESGEMLEAEPPAAPSAPPMSAPPVGPGPVTARFAIQTPPPEAYIDPHESGEMLEASDEPASGPATVDAPAGVPMAGAAKPAAEAYGDAETPPPEAYLDSPEPPGESGGEAGSFEVDDPPAAATELFGGTPSPASPNGASSGLAPPVANSEPQQPALQTPHELIERIALNVSSTANPAVDGVEAVQPLTAAAPVDTPAEESRETLPLARSFVTPPDNSVELATSEGAQPALPVAEPRAEPAAELAAETVEEPPSTTEAPPSESASAPAASVAESAAPASETAEAVPSVEPQIAKADIANPLVMTAEPAAETAPLPATEPIRQVVADEAPPIAVEAVVPPTTPAPTAATATRLTPAATPMTANAPVAAAPIAAPTAVPGTKVESAVAASALLAAAPAPALAMPVFTPPAHGLAPAALPTAQSGDETAAIQADSLLARVRRLHEADTISHEIPDPGLASATRPAPVPAETTDNPWPPVVLGFIGGVIITIVIVLVIQMLH
ncbi:MAG TPA: protein kinase [Planctomycetota bacterium]|nr:protein kinase [Planctomycetota bacterium]